MTAPHPTAPCVCRHPYAEHAAGGGCYQCETCEAFELNGAPARRARYVHALRRLADLIEREALPLPTTAAQLSWYVRGDDPRGDAAAIAAALGGEWQADGSPGSSYLSARAFLVGTPGDYGDGVLAVRVSMPYERPEAVQPPELVFATELTAAAEGDRQALVAAQGEPIGRAALEAAGLIEGESSGGCSCGARFSIDDLDDHLEVCPLPDPTDEPEGEQ